MEEFKDTILQYLPTVGYALLIIAAGVLLTLLITFIMKKAMKRSKMDPSLVGFFIRLIRIACYTIIAIAALTRLGISTAGLIAFFSAAVAAVALALKDNISDIASGIIILFTRPFVTGDFIEFGGYKGTVMQIDMIQTKLLTYDDTNIIIPNSRITSNEINNYTQHPEMRIVLKVPVSYSADIDEVKRVLFDTVGKVENILTDSAHSPQVRLEQYGESSLDFTLRCWCAFKDYWTVYYTLTENVKKALDANNIPIPFNQLDVHIIDDKPDSGTDNPQEKNKQEATA